MTKFGLSFCVCTLLASCDGFVIELDPLWSQDPFQILPSHCNNFKCDPTPSCDGPPESCENCGCCPCFNAESRCDLNDDGIMWQCENQCLMPQICEIGTICRPIPENNLAICEQHDSATPTEPCIPCDNEQNTSFCDHGFGFAPSAVIHCNAAGCRERQQCHIQEACVESFLTQDAQCESELDCDFIGCTGVNICGINDVNCGPCGCCQPDHGDLCWPGDLFDTRLIAREDDECYRTEPCPANRPCFLTDEAEAHCD